MPTTRRRISHAMAFMLTPQAIDAWRRGDVLACRQSLGVMPWDHCPFTVPDKFPECYADRGWGDAMNRDSWQRALELRQALIELAGGPSPYDRHGAKLG
jgi:hypothetical protein